VDKKVRKSTADAVATEEDLTRSHGLALDKVYGKKKNLSERRLKLMTL
jgi:hypothetical protein